MSQTTYRRRKTTVVTFDVAEIEALLREAAGAPMDASVDTNGQWISEMTVTWEEDEHA